MNCDKALKIGVYPTLGALLLAACIFRLFDQTVLVFRVLVIACSLIIACTSLIFLTKRKIPLFLGIGLAVCFLADVFISLLFNVLKGVADVSIFQNIGFVLFLAAHILFALHLKMHLVDIIIRIALPVVVIVVLLIMGKLTLRLGILSFYGVTLLTNVVIAFLRFWKAKTNTRLLLFVGLLVFFISDSLIVVRSLMQQGAPYLILDLLVWLTYIPALSIILYAGYREACSTNVADNPNC